MGIGFEFKETMSGHYHRLDTPGVERPLSFTVSARSPRLERFAKEGVVELGGTIDAEGLAKAQPVQGTINMGALLRSRLPYSVSFKGDDGRAYRLAGSKRVSLRRLARSMSVLPASIFDDTGKLIAQCELTFDLRSDLLSFARSFKLARA